MDVTDVKLLRNAASQEAVENGINEYWELPFDISKEGYPFFMGDSLDALVDLPNYLVLVYDDPDEERLKEDFLTRLDELVEGEPESEEIRGRNVYKVNDSEYRVYDEERQIEVQTMGSENPVEDLTRALETIDGDRQSVMDNIREGEDLHFQVGWPDSDLTEQHVIGASGSQHQLSNYSAGELNSADGGPILIYDPQEDVVYDSIWDFDSKEVVEQQQRDPDSLAMEFGD